MNSTTRPDYSKMPKLDRCALAERIFVGYPRLQSILNKVEHCHRYSEIAAEPECMFIGGLQGAGKTTLQEYYSRQFPRSTREDDKTVRTIVPVLCGRVPNKATDKNLASELLKRLGDPLHEKGSAYNQTSRLIGLMKECETKLVMLDEFQHFADKDSRKVLKTVSDWLKVFIDESGTPMIIIGMPYADRILDAPGNEQLQRRFAVRASLDSFGWKSRADKMEFRSFLKVLEGRLPLVESSNLSDPTMAFRFYCATNGRVGNVMKIVRRATELALDRSSESLDLDVLACAYEDRLRADHPDRVNSFDSNIAGLKVVPFEEHIPDFGETGRRSKGGVIAEKASRVLHT